VDVEIRRLEPGDEEVVLALAPAESRPSREHAARLLASHSTHYLVAFSGDEPVGFLLAYELLRRHREPASLLLYEIGVTQEHRRRGVGRALYTELRRLARERGIGTGWVLTDEANPTAMRFYEALGGVRARPDDVLYDFRF
jgi:GNAT superfamily N-acetyltransferase